MEKIFEDSTMKYLQELNISDKEIKILQLKALKEGSLKILKEVTSIIEKGDYKNLEPYLSFSPSGDCMGLDNHFINFGSICSEDNTLDIKELVDYLTQLETECR